MLLEGCFNGAFVLNLTSYSLMLSKHIYESRGSVFAQHQLMKKSIWLHLVAIMENILMRYVNK